MERKVVIVEAGRAGGVSYLQGPNAITGSWEFGGGEVLAIVHLGGLEQWRRDHPWAVDQRATILRFVADEVVRQKAPGCSAAIDTERGEILLRRGEGRDQAPPPVRPAGMQPNASAEVAWYHRWRDLRMKLALVVSAAALGIGALVWMKNKVMVIDPGRGTPFGTSVRAHGHIATLIQSLEPYTPSLHRNAGEDRYTVRVLLVPLDGGDPRLVKVAEHLRPSEFALATVLGSDGRSLWYDVGGVGTIDLSTYDVHPAGSEVPKDLQGPGRSRIPDRPERYLAAGYISAPGAWTGLHGADELAGTFAPGKFVRRVVGQEQAKVRRWLCRGSLEDPVQERYHRIRSMDRVDTTGYLNAAFLRLKEEEEPLRLHGPDGALMAYTSGPDRNGTLMVARVDEVGTVRWKVDTGLDHFLLQQILPGEEAFAFVGTRPPVPGKVSEPLLVIVDNTSGRSTVHSLWR